MNKKAHLSSMLFLINIIIYTMILSISYDMYAQGVNLLHIIELIISLTFSIFWYIVLK